TYRGVFNRAMADWLDRPLGSITADAVLKRHAELSQQSGPALANLAMRIAGAVFTFAMAKYVDQGGADPAPQPRQGAFGLRELEPDGAPADRDQGARATEVVARRAGVGEPDRRRLPHFRVADRAPAS